MGKRRMFERGARDVLTERAFRKKTKTINCGLSLAASKSRSLWKLLKSVSKVGGSVTGNSLLLLAILLPFEAVLRVGVVPLAGCPK